MIRAVVKSLYTVQWDKIERGACLACCSEYCIVCHLHYYTIYIIYMIQGQYYRVASGRVGGCIWFFILLGKALMFVFCGGTGTKFCGFAASGTHSNWLMFGTSENSIVNLLRSVINIIRLLWYQYSTYSPILSKIPCRPVYNTSAFLNREL